MTLYCYAFGCGFLWQLNSLDGIECRIALVRLCLYWRTTMLKPTREWALYRSSDGFMYREASPRRRGEWVLRGPIEKIA